MPKETLFIRQKKEIAEVLIDWESQNRYEILDQQQRPLFKAQENSSWIARMFLRAWRPFAIDISDGAGNFRMSLDKGFAFFLHRVEVHDQASRCIGAIQRELTFFQRNYLVEDKSHRTIFKLEGPFLSPWTFNIIRNGMQIGVIKKKWSGLLTESFTDADNFTVEFPSEIAVEQKELLLAAVLLIDFIHFEK